MSALRHMPPRGMDEAIAWKCQRCKQWITEPPKPDDFCAAAPTKDELGRE